jgi:hypothetical protein
MVLKDLMKYYSDKDNHSDSTKSTTTSKTLVTNLQWKGIGMYTGEVNDKIEPHGDGKLLMFSGALLQGRWANGRPVSHDGPIEADDDKDTTSTPSVTNNDATTQAQAERVKENEKASSPIKKTSKQDERSYKVGDEGRRRDMIKDKDKDVALMRIASLQPDDAAFIRRTDGTWTFSRVKKVTSDTIYFIVNSSGSTKSYNAKYWHSHVRTCKIPVDKVKSKKLTRKLSSTEMSDSDASVPKPILQHSPSQQSPKKEKSPPKTYEIGKVREYDATKNRFSVKNLKPPSSIDNSESSRDTTLDGSTGKSLPPPPATGNLRRGRFSFHGDGQYVSRKRNVSFSPARHESTYNAAKDAPDSPDATEDEDDNFDVNGAISQRGYSLRGIEP